MEFEPVDKEEAWQACKTGPRRGDDVPIIFDLYEIQDYLERANEIPKSEAVIRARLGLKLFIWIHDALIDAELMEQFMDHLHEHNEGLFWTLQDWRDQELKRKYGEHLSVVDDSGVGSVSESD